MIKKITKMIALAGLLCATSFGATDVMPAEIKVIGSPGVRGAVLALVPQFERETGHKVITEFVVIAVIKRKIEAGEAFDIAIPSPDLIDDLVKQGKVAADTRIAFGRTGLGVAARKGIPTPDISSVEAFKRTLLNAKTVGHSKEGQTGVNFLIVLDKLGIAGEMKPKLRTYQGNELAEALVKGTEEIGVTGIGPVLEMRDVQVLGGLPPEIQRWVQFGAGVSANSKEPTAARALLKFMMAPEAATVAKTKGLER